MFKWLAREARKRRTIKYLAVHPEDEPAVMAIVMSVEMFGLGTVKSARKVAEVTAKRKITDEEWNEFGPRWERAWYYIIR